MSCGKRKRGKRRFIHIECTSDHGFDGPFRCDGDSVPQGFGGTAFMAVLTSRIHKNTIPSMGCEHGHGF